ncbi:MAG: hypothetical protein AB7F19_02315 [Candidatus Babeliales bacterium]
MKRRFIWQKLRKHIYRHMEESDKTMYALAYFLNDGLPYAAYLKFLEEGNRQNLSGNISCLEKQRWFQ